MNKANWKNYIGVLTSPFFWPAQRRSSGPGNPAITQIQTLSGFPKEAWRMASPGTIQHESGTAVSIADLPAIVLRLLERAPGRSLLGIQGQPDLLVRYLRRKPGRGLVIVYQAGHGGSAPERSVTVTIGEPALVGTRIRLCARQLDQASLELQAPGVLSTDVGLTMQVFPADSGLPALAAACAPDPGGPLFRALERGARVQLCDTRCRLISAKAEPVRYNPASRCVIRYRLALERSTRKGTLQRDMTLFGKVYRDPVQAREVHAWMQQFNAEHAQSGEPIVPRPLGIAESLGLTLSEAIESPQGLAPETLRTGLRVFQPRGSEEVFDVIPDRELRLTAVALARLHTSAVWPAGAPRTGAVEARRVSERAAEIASRYPAQAETAQKIANQLTSRLE